MAIVQDIIQNEDGENVTIFIEVADTTTSGWNNTRTLTGQAEDSFRKANVLIRDCAVNIARTVRDIQTKTQPKEIEVQFAVKIDTTIGVMVAQASTEAQLQVTLRWGEKDS